MKRTLVVQYVLKWSQFAVWMTVLWPPQRPHWWGVSLQQDEMMDGRILRNKYCIRKEYTAEHKATDFFYTHHHWLHTSPLHTHAANSQHSSRPQEKVNLIKPMIDRSQGCSHRTQCSVTLMNILPILNKFCTGTKVISAYFISIHQDEGWISLLMCFVV